MKICVMPPFLAFYTLYNTYLVHSAWLRDTHFDFMINYGLFWEMEHSDLKNSGRMDFFGVNFSIYVISVGLSPLFYFLIAVGSILIIIWYVLCILDREKERCYIVSAESHKISFWVFMCLYLNRIFIWHCPKGLQLNQ